MALKRYSGGCHCGTIRFEVEAPRDLWAFDCNCSICRMKRNTHFVVPAASLRLLSGEEQLTKYQFNTRQAVHLFCSICGVASFYRPRSNPDGWAVTVHCLDEDCRPSSLTVRSVDGQNWEGNSAILDMANLSKPA
ncbi:hypothetical protein WJX73_009449 [Symbiochloris irregularis]|uniref:CENP-V/GFA domain-containing protein n=1 Tax=Symbiochloris irregularis TaxID=706552 RepID=A0AAW1P2Y8_9CHLO